MPGKKLNNRSRSGQKKSDKDTLDQAKADGKVTTVDPADSVQHEMTATRQAAEPDRNIQNSMPDSADDIVDDPRTDHIPMFNIDRYNKEMNEEDSLAKLPEVLSTEDILKHTVQQTPSASSVSLLNRGAISADVAGPLPPMAQHKARNPRASFNTSQNNDRGMINNEVKQTDTSLSFYPVERALSAGISMLNAMKRDRSADQSLDISILSGSGEMRGRHPRLAEITSGDDNKNAIFSDMLSHVQRGNYQILEQAMGGLSRTLSVVNMIESRRRIILAESEITDDILKSAYQLGKFGIIADRSRRYSRILEICIANTELRSINFIFSYSVLIDLLHMLIGSDEARILQSYPNLFIDPKSAESTADIRSQSMLSSELIRTVMTKGSSTFSEIKADAINYMSALIDHQCSLLNRVSTNIILPTHSKGLTPKCHLLLLRLVYSIPVTKLYTLDADRQSIKVSNECNSCIGTISDNLDMFPTRYLPVRVV